ncbi:ABC transporter ATP-binding protein [Corynebacterium doosanense]|uniref:Iron dicitrate ABC transporter ATP-binding protein n=1 Tax=Corynebacterium doosanense CAU 212 = DSM 45436 TaxID=558173 RepID=A0A097ICQ5_9CORY|nr:ABC transporter ATP-binding protein [Corynebacterium doosanense]AIT59912.1 iron dicitrate ABC transporter ATP-binding protein [Corynebacterium doosanense CAU 212 = DSM 45436]
MSVDHTLDIHDLHLGYGERQVVTGLDLTIAPGRITSIVGPNGCGKSTLLRALSRLLKPTSGEVLLDARPLHERPSKELARIVGLLPQTPVAPEGIVVADLVGRGRHPHQGFTGRWSPRDYEVVARSLELTHTTELAERSIDELSGGQRQRVWIAMALAQETDILLLDEPTTYLDIANQLEILDLLIDLNREHGTTIVMVLHDIGLAARYSDELVAISNGKLYSAGDPAQVVTEQTMSDVFGLDCRVIEDPVSGSPLVLPIGRHFAKEH